MPPTGDPLEEVILANIESTLDAIAEGSDYFTEIRYVHRFRGAYPDLNGNYPAVVVIDLGSDFEDDASQRVDVLNTERMNVQIDFWQDERTEASAKLRRAKHDITKALLEDRGRGANPTHGGRNALTTIAERSIPFFSPNVANPVSMIELGFTVVFRAYADDPTKPG